MRVEAVKQKGGWFIPMIEEFEFMGKDRIIMDITIMPDSSAAFRKRSEDPLKKFIGRFKTRNLDWADNHDELLGAFADDADIVDKVVECAMKTREDSLLRAN